MHGRHADAVSILAERLLALLSLPLRLAVVAFRATEFRSLRLRGERQPVRRAHVDRAGVLLAVAGRRYPEGLDDLSGYRSRPRDNFLARRRVVGSGFPMRRAFAGDLTRPAHPRRLAALPRARLVRRFLPADATQQRSCCCPRLLCPSATVHRDDAVSRRRPEAGPPPAALRLARHDRSRAVGSDPFHARALCRAIAGARLWRDPDTYPGRCWRLATSTGAATPDRRGQLRLPVHGTAHRHPRPLTEGITQRFNRATLSG